jgi:hypothetical protein
LFGIEPKKKSFPYQALEIQGKILRFLEIAHSSGAKLDQMEIKPPTPQFYKRCSTKRGLV